jgi:hypothetical protein
MTKLNREIVLQTLKGYEEVNRITAREERERLKKMTEKEARAIFDDLCMTALKITNQQPMSQSAKWFQFEMAHRIKLRKAMVKLSRALGYESAT